MAHSNFMQSPSPPASLTLGAAPDALVRLSLHGAVSLQVGTQPAASLERKTAALLAYLHHEGQTPRARLAGLLWPEASNESARGNLRQCIGRLRKLTSDVLTESGGLLALSPDVVIEAPASADAALLGAFDYADCEDLARWIEGRQQADQSRRRAGLLAEIKQATQLGELDRAQALADALLALDRESEDPYRALMEVGYLRGDFAAAIAVWDRCREMLRQLYGVAPSPATRELGETILAAAREGDSRRAAPAQTIPLSVLRPPRLIARAAELAAMLAGWRDSRIVCVCGEAGIGKSRLLAEFAGAIGACVSVAARPGDAVAPYAALTRLVAAAIDRHHPPMTGDAARWVARLLPAIAHLVPDAPTAPLQTERERGLALQALRALLIACVHRGCAAFVLDDLQYADRATLEALPALIAAPDGTAPGAPANTVSPRFAFGSRPDEAGAPATALLDSWSEGAGACRVDLGPLADAEVHTLLASLDLPGRSAEALARRLRSQVGGNPAFLLESLKLLLSLATGHDEAAPIPVPASIQAVIQRRIALLSAPARHIAQLAAIAGGGYTVAMAAAALACPVFALTEPLRELELRQVLYGRQFVHDLVASAVQRSIPAAVAEFMQRFVAEHLEAHEGDPALIAGHWRACGEWRRAGLCHMRAAAAASVAVRPREQSEFLDAAAECFERCDASDDLFDALERRIVVIDVADRLAVRGRLLERMNALARTEAQQVRALLHRVAVAVDHARTEGLAELQEGLRRARALGQLELAFDFCQPITTQLAMQGEFDAAMALIESFAPWAEQQADVRISGVVERNLSNVHAFGDRLLPAIEHGQRANQLLRAAGDDLARLPAMSNIGLMHFWRGELGPARAMLVEAGELRDRLHGSGAGLVIDSHLAAVSRDLGEFADADERLARLCSQLRAMAKESREPPTDLVIAENHHAQLWLMLGQPARALECLCADDADTDIRFRARRLALRLRAERAEGHDVAALLETAAVLSPAINSAFNRAWFELQWFHSVEPGAAAAGFANLHAQAAVVERPGMQLQAALRAAQAEFARGERDAAGGWIVRATGLLEAVRPFDMDPAEAWRIADRVLRANGDVAAADRARRRGETLVEQTAAKLPPEWRAAYLQAQS